MGAGRVAALRRPSGTCRHEALGTPAYGGAALKVPPRRVRFRGYCFFRVKSTVTVPFFVSFAVVTVGW